MKFTLNMELKNKLLFSLLIISCCACSTQSNESNDLQQYEAGDIAIPDVNTLEGQAHRLLASHYPQPEYREFFFGSVYVGSKQNMPAVYKVMEEQGLCSIEVKTVSNYPICIVQLTPKALHYMVEGSLDSTSSRLAGTKYKADFKLFDVHFTGIVDVSEQPAFNAAQINYGIKRTNMTPFNEANLFDSGKKIYDDSRIQDTVQAYMQKTSQGWKLMK